MDTNKSPFFGALIQELVSSADNYYGAENWDAELYGESSVKGRVVALINRSLRRAVILPKPSFIEPVPQDVLEKLSDVYNLLADDFSKATLVKLIAYRILSFRKVKLPVNTDSYWSDRKFPGSLTKSSETIKIKFHDWVLKHLTLEKIGYPVEIFTLSAGAHIIFMLKQYVYGKKSPAIMAEAGDYVIDGGGGWGDTALFFAHHVGPQGKVFTFEFCPENLDVLRRNVNLNPKLAPRIEILTKALWDVSGVEMGYSANGPATAVAKAENGSSAVSTLSIDDLVKMNHLPRVDFIKMDIEGAELEALKGAENTLREFRPKLAISAYHKPDDLFVLPNYLKDLDVGYEFYMDHFTVYRGETVLYAIPKNPLTSSRA